MSLVRGTTASVGLGGRVEGFSIRPMDDGCYAIDHLDRTVAVVNSHGSVDWLLPSVHDDGPLVDSLYKETHLSYTLGLQIHLTSQTPATTASDIWLRSIGAMLEIRCTGASADGLFEAETTARLVMADDGERYEWRLVTLLTNVSDGPVDVAWLEYNNVYPSWAGRCFLYEPLKQYRSTLLVDRSGVVWECPHQHAMHYTRKIDTLEFACGSLAGFFDEPSGNPVVVIEESTLEPDWAICDRYYDLHCGARPGRPIAAGETLRFVYFVRYLNAIESAPLVTAAQPIPVDESDLAHFQWPRLELGWNSFTESVRIDRFDDASGFPQAPPERVWDRSVGRSQPGSLRLTGAGGDATVWAAVPPTDIPPGHRLTLSGYARTADVEGKGVTLRVRYSTWMWFPTPRTEWVATIESQPVTGTADWTRITVPVLDVPKDHLDYSVDIDVVLDGTGVAWVTDLELGLVPTPDA